MTPGAREALIGDIYECVLDPSGWTEVLGRVCAEVGGRAGWIAVHFPDRVASTYQIETGTDPDWQRRLRESYVASSPFIGMTHYVRAGDVLSVSDVIDYDEFTAGRFYREWASPQGWPDLIFAVLAREPDRFSFLGVCLPERATAAHKSRAALFLPHLDRALRIADLLELRDRELADLSSAVQAMATGVVLVDDRLGVRGINAAAEGLIAHRSDLACSNGHLRLSAAGAAVRAAIDACSAGAMDQTGASIALGPFEDSAGLTIHVVSLPRSQLRPAGGAVAALFVTSTDRTDAAPPESLVQRFGLTPSELRVALALSEGRTPRMIAVNQGVSLATVRTHLRRLYDKTGTSGQATLVRLVSTATLRV